MSATLSAVVISSAVGIFAASAWSHPGTVASDQDAVARGQALFAQHCASCHGKEGKGNGPSASSLAIKPGDLTRMERRYGAFLAPQVESAIKGTNPGLVHRAPNMVVWGALLRSEPRGDRGASEARVRDLVAFVKSIQEQGK